MYSIFNNKKFFLALVLLAVSLVAPAQNGINSPYSQYGIGLSSMPYNMPWASALGGVTSTRSSMNMINPFNPASYAAIGKETLVFDMGLTIDMTTLRGKSGSQFDADGNLGYMALGFPLTRWWKTALGVMPLSDVNYQSVSTQAVNPGGEVKTRYEGNGGVSQLFWGHAFNVLGGGDASKPQLRAGFNVDFIFGNLTRAVTYDFTANDTTYMMDSRSQKDTYVRNLLLDLGLQYDQPVGDKHHLGVGLTVRPHRSMTVRDNALVYTFVTNAASEYMRDTIFPLDGGDSEFESSLEQPFTTSVGVSFQRDNRWLVALDATFAPWSGLKYTENSSYSIFGQSPLRYGSSQRWALGLQLLGDKNAASYMRRVTFSAGAHYESGRLQMQMTDGTEYKLNEWGVGAGVSLPMRKGRSVLNISAAYSSMGTVDLLRRDVFTVGISVGSCESWFVKRKFN
jgi:hypothetical protein